LTLLPVVAAFAGSWLVARFSGPTVWGTVSWAMALATLLLILARLGLGVGASRLASEIGARIPGQLRGLYTVALRMRAVATALVAGLTWVLAGPLARAIGNAGLTGAVRMAAAVVVGASIYEFHEQFVVGLNRHAIVSRVRALMLSLRLVATATIVALGLGAVAVLGGYVAAWLVAIGIFAGLLAWRLPRSEVHARGRRQATDRVPDQVHVQAPDETSSRAGADEPHGSRAANPDRAHRGHSLRHRLLAISLPLAISSASVTVYSQMDKLMIGYFDSIEEVGQYAIARAVVEVALFPAFALVMTLRPALASRYSLGQVGECSRLFAGSLRLAFVTGVLAASVLSALAVPLFRAVYTLHYAYAGTLMVTFAAVIVMRAPGALVLPALVAAERTRLYAVLTTVSAGANFLLNLVLIPKYHARGAILATVVSYSVLLTVGLWQSFGIFGMRPRAAWFDRAARTLLAGVIAAGVIRVLSDRVRLEGAETFALAAAQVALYAGLVLVFGVVKRGDLAVFRHNLLKRNV